MPVRQKINHIYVRIRWLDKIASASLITPSKKRREQSETMKTDIGSENRAAIEEVVLDYLEGMVFGQPEKLKRAMHPLCMQAGHYKGVYEFFSRDEFISSLAQEQHLAEGTPVKASIGSLDITGDVAVVRLADTCFGTTFTDYLTLIRHEGRWQIVMKAFYDHANNATL